MTANNMFVVGIGASAGGVEALQDFFRQVPNDTGAAFVVVQHLSPNFESLMDQLLQRVTSLNVHIATENVALIPNSVYLIPPNYSMTIKKNSLHLGKLDGSQRPSYLIDNFLISLALEKRENAIAVILSGTGSDGSNGIQAISEAGGLVLCQEPEEAKFNGMPQSAISTKKVNSILPAGEMSLFIGNFIKNPIVPVKSAREQPSEILEELFYLLQERYGVNFKDYKESTVTRRISRRIKILGLQTLKEYHALLSEDNLELDNLFHDLLIGVTYFFRNFDAFDYLDTEIISKIFEANKGEENIRVWVAGCASGEEVYSLAILFAEHNKKYEGRFEIKIFATDVNTDSLEIASLGTYLESHVKDVKPHLLEEYFVKEGLNYRATSEIRNLIVFTKQNVCVDSPFTKIDLVVCRNLLIYLNPSVQKKALSAFNFSLKKGGYLFLGPSESLGDLEPSFHTMHSKHKVFKKVSNEHAKLADLGFAGSHQYSKVGSMLPRRHFPSSEYDSILDSILEDSIILNRSGDVIHITGKGSDYVSMQSGKISNNISDLIDKDLRSILTTGIYRAQDELKVVVLNQILWKGKKKITIKITPVLSKKKQLYLIIVTLFEAKENDAFNDYDPVNHLVKDLEIQLGEARSALRDSLDEANNTNEELQSTNEELLASNEELQSTNEELHSVNEELFTVNSEFQSKIGELSKLEDDIANITAAGNLSIIVVDRNHNIRRITPSISEMFGILLRDIGRPLNLFLHIFDYEKLSEEIKKVISSNKSIVKSPQLIGKNRLELKVSPYIVRGKTEGAILQFRRKENDLFSSVDVASEGVYSSYASAELPKMASGYGRLLTLLSKSPSSMEKYQSTIQEATRQFEAYHKLLEQNIEFKDFPLSEVIDSLDMDSNLVKVNSNLANKALVHSEPKMLQGLLEDFLCFQKAHGQNTPIEMGRIELHSGVVTIYIRSQSTHSHLMGFEEIFSLSALIDLERPTDCLLMPLSRLKAFKLRCYFWHEKLDELGETIFVSVPLAKERSEKEHSS